MSGGGPPWPPQTPGHFRVSQAEREAVAEQLRQHTADGRLTLDEFDERLDACLKSKTYDELGQVLRDLPAARPATPIPHPPPAATQWNMPPHVVLLAAALIAAIVAAFVTHYAAGFVLLAIWCGVMLRRAYRRSTYVQLPPPPPGGSDSAGWSRHYPSDGNYRSGTYHGRHDQQV